jgi:hypothetical protein
MPIPSLHRSRGSARAWSVARAAAYGAGIGVLAGLFKTLGPWHDAAPAAARFLQIAIAVFAFALLCAGAALLRNLIARRLIWMQ